MMSRENETRSQEIQSDQIFIAKGKKERIHGSIKIRNFKKQMKKGQ